LWIESPALGILTLLIAIHPIDTQPNGVGNAPSEAIAATLIGAITIVLRGNPTSGTDAVKARVLAKALVLTKALVTDRSTFALQAAVHSKQIADLMVRVRTAHEATADASRSESKWGLHTA